jgi:hypothetical protein
MAEIDVSDLYGLPLAGFTSARNALAKQARTQGDREQAERIGGLPKPTLSAWVLNMLARLRKEELAELVRSGEQAEAAQAEVLAGGGDGGQLREASERLRRLARGLAAEGGEILVKGGHAAREQTLLRVARALEAGAATAEGRRQLQRGESTVEPQAAGFDLFAQPSTPPSGKPRRTAAGKPSRQPDESAQRRAQAEARQAARRAAEAVRAELRERRAERAEAEAASRQAERTALVKQREAEQAQQRVERSRQRAERARAAELKARQRLEEAQKRLRSRK